MDSSDNKVGRRASTDLTNANDGGNMHSLDNKVGRQALTDSTNDNNGGVSNVSNLPSQVTDAKKSKQERDRIRAASRRAAMTDEEREEVNKKHREAYHLKNHRPSTDGSDARDKENMDPRQGEACKHMVVVAQGTVTPNNPGVPDVPSSTSQLIEPKMSKQELDIKRAAARRAAMTNEQREEMNRKRREARHQKKHGQMQRII